MRVTDPNPDAFTPEPVVQPQAVDTEGSSCLAERQAFGDALDLSALSELSLAASAEGRLSQLRAKVQSGSYRVPALEVAKKIVDKAVKPG